MLAAWVLLSIRMTVCIQGEGSVPSSQWAKSRALAEHIFSNAGIETVWLRAEACHPPALCVSFARERPSGVHSDAAGFAVFADHEPGGYAAVYLPAVAETAHSLNVDPALVIGATIAHEIGHLLLRSSAHSSGVMNARFDAREMRAAGRGELVFPGEVAQRIRTALASRPALSASCPPSP